MSFKPLNQGVSIPGVDYGGADGSVLFDINSKTNVSPAVQISFTPVVIKAYNLREGESIAVNNYYANTNQSSPYTRAGTVVVLTPENTTEVLFLTGAYKLVFTGTLGALIVTSTGLPKVRLVGADGITAGMLRSELAFPNPLFENPDSTILSTKVQIGPMPWVFRAYGLSGDEEITVLNVYSSGGVDTVVPLSVAGVDAVITAANNTLVLDLAGTYQFQLTAPIDGLILTGHETAAESIDPYTLYETQVAAATAAQAAEEAAASATAASVSETAAANSASAAAGSASTASAAQASATASAATATTEAGIATTQAGIATTAQTSATASAAAAAASATTAGTDAANAGVSAAAALVSQNAAATSATTASTAATTATTEAGIATTAATTATTQAGLATTGASTATTQATAASSSAAGAASSASGAASSATTATNAAAAAAASAAAPRLHNSLAISSSAGVVTIDLSNITEDYYLTLTENVTSWVFNNPPASGFDAKISIFLTQNATAKTCVSPATSGHTAGGTWTVSATANAIQKLDLTVDHSGTRSLVPNAVFS